MAHQLVWLNPLLRFDGFEPRAAGVRALLPHVDRFLPVHNLASLADLGSALRAPAAGPSHPAALNTPWNCKANDSSPPRCDKTWAALNDPEMLKACIAGCESLERTGDDAFAALVAVKVGPVSARFKGNLKMTQRAGAEQLHDQLRRPGRRGRLRQGLGRRVAGDGRRGRRG